VAVAIRLSVCGENQGKAEGVKVGDDHKFDLIIKHCTLPQICKIVKTRSPRQ
jgi:hypothetical protein